jgi:hypothetical protein
VRFWREILIYFHRFIALFACVYTGGVVILLFLVPVVVSAFFALNLSLIAFKVFPSLILDQKSRLHWRNITRIAIARRGIYVDEFDTPKRTALRRRIIHRFEDIKSCTVDQTEPFGLIIYRVTVKNFKGNAVLKIDGLLDAKRFAETVNRLLMEKKWRPLDDSSNVFVV